MHDLKGVRGNGSRRETGGQEHATTAPAPGHHTPNIVVIGGSAGSIEGLQRLLGQLPADLPAALLVVVHVSPAGNSRLPAVLGRAGKLPASYAEDGQAIEPGRIYIAPPDLHMLVREGKGGSRIALSHGPRENHTRPAIDPTLRTAAHVYGRRVTAIILSGVLSDGNVGLAVVKAHGGTAIVQDPDEALFDGMPRSAIRFVQEIDHVLPLGEIAPLLVRLTQGAARQQRQQQSRGGKEMREIERIESMPGIIR